MSSRFSFATGENTDYLEGLYQQYKVDPGSVDPEWQKFFEGYEFAAHGTGTTVSIDEAQTHARVEALVNAYRRLGHLSAYINPLQDKPSTPDTMTLEYHGLHEGDLDGVFHPANFGEKPTSLREIRDRLTLTYCGKVGADFRDTNHIEMIEWLQEKMESCNNQPELSKDLKKRILFKLSEAEGFEKFLHTRYLGQKRFSLEGCDTLIPMLDVLLTEGADLGAEEFCLGMAHRGRLNVLANIMGKPMEHMLREFEGSEFNPFDIDGDVKYHMGFGNVLDLPSGKKMRVYLSPNPSHLEVVNPVVEGFVRCRQRLSDDQTRKKIVPVLLHGDAAFVGQGVVAETLNLSQLPSYTTGGTIHIITNNQVGFTTDALESRSCEYSSDIAKGIRAPVLHVNADDPEACVWVAQLAIAYRQEFHQDVVIDLMGYRRHGHNEGDEPSFTQPSMYKVIGKHPTALTQYKKKIVDEGTCTGDEVAAIEKDFKTRMQNAFELVRSGKKIDPVSYPEGFVESLTARKIDYGEALADVESTKVSKEILLDVGTKLASYPDNFTIHPKLKRILGGRTKMFEGEGSIDWGTGELLAFGTLAVQGHHVRLSGQDCKRGTFSSRHGVFFDYESGAAFEPLNELSKDQARVDIINSVLSEAGCLGFEFGYSVADKKAFVAWEAQFGDFANGAQIVIDQFLAASEAKWRQTCGLVLLLPHGYEGMGPEHSSARPERFLQLCGGLNMQVCNITTPAQHFHMLRRQVSREFRKPLVVMTPKSLLRHPEVTSKISDFTDGIFKEVLDDPGQPDPSTVERLILCSGKIYYELDALRKEGKGNGTVALVRMEQLYPFPQKSVNAILEKYSKASSVIWAQEEPQNMGSWSFLRPRLELILPEERELTYVGRKYSGTTAEGSGKAHQAEQRRILEEALGAACGWEPKKKKA